MNGTCGWSRASTRIMTTCIARTGRRGKARLPGVRIHPLQVQMPGFSAGTGLVA
jgi:hypothetical protein